MKEQCFHQFRFFVLRESPHELMFVSALKINRAFYVIFGTMVLLLVLLAIGDATGNAMITRIAGYEGLICGFSAIYTSLAQICNEIYGKTIAPIGPVK